MSIATLLILGFVLRTTISVRSLLAGLTARSACGWGIAACLVAMLAVGMRILPVVPDGLTSATHSLAATLCLAPLLDVLGARNPGHRAWPWFVITPMIIVLQWSTASHLVSEHLQTPVTTPLPATIGFLLILVMGTGNYFGTANTTACLIGATGICLFALPVWEWADWPQDGLCLAGSICLAVTALLVEGRLKTGETEPGHEQLWTDFRDTYGLVWARRVMDRINQFADRENWTVTMTLDGFLSRDGSESAADDLQRPIEILRWVLRRFADTAWLDSRLPSDPASGEESSRPGSED